MILFSTTLDFSTLITEECTFEFFFEHYSEILNFTPLQMDKLQEEFTTYQLLQ